MKIVASVGISFLILVSQTSCGKLQRETCPQLEAKALDLHFIATKNAPLWLAEKISSRDIVSLTNSYIGKSCCSVMELKAGGGSLPDVFLYRSTAKYRFRSHVVKNNIETTVDATVNKCGTFTQLLKESHRVN